MSVVKNISPAIVASAPKASAPIDQRDTLRDAIAACNLAGATDKTASATLQGIVLERFAYHAHNVTQVMSNQSKTLPNNHKRAVQGLVWRDATGSDKPVAQAERDAHKGFKSLGVYLSRFASVATNDLLGGLEALASVEAVNSSYDAILGARKDAKASEDVELANAASAELNEWFKSLPASDQTAINRTRELFTGDSVGCAHAKAYVASFNIEK